MTASLAVRILAVVNSTFTAVTNTTRSSLSTVNPNAPGGLNTTTTTTTTTSNANAPHLICSLLSDGTVTSPPGSTLQQCQHLIGGVQNPLTFNELSLVLSVGLAIVSVFLGVRLWREGPLGRFLIGYKGILGLVKYAAGDGNLVKVKRYGNVLEPYQSNALPFYCGDGGMIPVPKANVSFAIIDGINNMAMNVPLADYTQVLNGKRPWQRVGDWMRKGKIAEQMADIRFTSFKEAVLKYKEDLILAPRPDAGRMYPPLQSLLPESSVVIQTTRGPAVKQVKELTPEEQAAYTSISGLESARLQQIDVYRQVERAKIEAIRNKQTRILIPKIGGGAQPGELEEVDFPMNEQIDFFNGTVAQLANEKESIYQANFGGRTVDLRDFANWNLSSFHPSYLPVYAQQKIKEFQEGQKSKGDNAMKYAFAIFIGCIGLAALIIGISHG